MVTINDIAIKANVSAGTVDRVLHNRGGVSIKTANRINKILAENNFKINAAASSLANKKRRIIAVLIPDYSETNTFWKDTYLGVEKAKEEVLKFGVQTEIFTFNQFDGTSYLNSFNALLEKQPDAVIIAPTFRIETTQIIKELEVQKTPYLFINIDLDGFNNISFLGQESYKSGYLAGKLMEISLKKEAVITVIQTNLNVENNQALSNRVSGFCDYFYNNAIPLEIIKINIENIDDLENVKSALKLALESNPAVSGIFVPSSRVALFVNCIEETTIENLAIIGFDGTEHNLNSLKENKISFLISQKSFNQGYDSIKLMVDYLIEKKKPEKKMYSPIEILTKENI